MANTKAIARMRDLTYQIYCDITNGLNRQDILTKLREDKYDGFKTSETKDRQHRKYIEEAYKLAKEFFEDEREHAREMAYNRLLSVYNDSVTANDRQNALRAIEIFNKLSGLYESQNKVEISGDNVVVKFGFNEDNGDTI